jgi:hypothetical protein
MVSFHPWLTNFSYQLSLPVTSGGIVNALFLGFSAAMLGISVLKAHRILLKNKNKGCSKTLRNMWAIVIFNPMIALLLICIIPLAEVGEHKESLLAFRQTTGGSWLAYLISIDAVLVLCGAVLTSFVGVSGLLNHDIR